jgi:predicted CXXCH cytochrome family protein
MSPQVSRALGAAAALALAAASAAGAAEERRLRPRGPGDDCLACHHALVSGKKVVHPPVARGLCVACHAPLSETEHLFGWQAEGKAMCRQCHAPRDLEKVRHNPVEQGLCLYCHDPHASNHHVRLRLPIFETCTQCHPSKRIQDATSATRHGALDPKLNPLVCVACHDPHQSDHEKRLKQWPPMNVCLTCHDKVVQGWDRPLLDMKGWLDQFPDEALRHGPVREGMCNRCHEPHGTNEFRMLRGSFPPEFYWPYKPGDTYGLCFGCHDRRLIEVQKIDAPAAAARQGLIDWGKVEAPAAFEPRPGERLVRAGTTGFRNGDENLHFKHTNKPDKGRTCRDCHDFHASPNPKHVRTSTRFGSWEFKLNYVKTETGARCWPGCHVERRYDRILKQENPR